MPSSRPAGRMRAFARRLLIAVVVLQAVAAGQARGETAPGERVIHFPPDRCLGRLEVYRFPLTGPIEHVPGQESHFDSQLEYSNSWEFFHEARGDVVVPKNKLIQLTITPQNFKDLRYLRHLKPDDLDILSIDGSAPWTAGYNAPVMPYLSGLTGLKELSISFINISGSDLQHLSGMNSLKFLKIFRTDKSLDAGLPYLSKLKSLEHLELDGCTDAGLQALAGLPALKILWLGIDHIQGPGLAHLQKLPALRSLTLTGSSFSDAGLAYIKNLTSLTRLHLFCVPGGDWPVTDAGLAHLSGLKDLEELRFTKIRGLTEAGMVHLKPLRSLKKLAGLTITDVGLAQLEGMKSLESLEYFAGSDTGLAWLAKTFKLKELRVSGEQITDEGARHLATIRSLEALSLSNTSVTDAGMDSVAQLTNLQRLSLFCSSERRMRLGLGGGGVRLRPEAGQPGGPLTDEGLARLAPLKSLKSLSLANVKIPISGLSHLNALSNLINLSIKEVQQDNSGMNLSGLTKLEKLRIDAAKGSAIRDEDLACLAGLKHLRNLQFSFPERMAMGDQGLKHLAGLTNLDTLVVGSNVTDDGLSYLDNMKKLHVLGIAGDFTNQGLRHLEGLNGLSVLSIYPERPFGRTALNRLQQKLPNCSVHQNFEEPAKK